MHPTRPRVLHLGRTRFFLPAKHHRASRGGRGPVAPPPAVEIEWFPLDNGCQTQLTGTEVHISGISNQDGWGHWNGVETHTDFPPGDFVAEVDMKVARFDGVGEALVYLQAKSGAGDKVGILFKPHDAYQLQAWTDPARFAGGVHAFGDEATNYHHLKLQYDASTQTATGWVDGTKIGEMQTPLGGRVQFALGGNTDRKGMEIDMTFDHFKLTTAGTTP